MTTSLQTITRYDPAPAIERSVRALAIAFAFTYAAGYTTGRWIHRLAAALAALNHALRQPNWPQHCLAPLRQHRHAPTPPAKPGLHQPASAPPPTPSTDRRTRRRNSRQRRQSTPTA